MEYISTRNNKKSYSFRDIFLKGLAPDGGLFVPKRIQPFKQDEINGLNKLSYNELAIEIISKFSYTEFTENELKEIVNISYKNFRVKDVVELKKYKDVNILELFHGPTLAFKDIAMQVIGNMYERILKKNNLSINIIVATSGDTGAAAISAIKNRKNMKIFVLHPENKISEVQRKFMTTVNSDNVFNIALESNFDECQRFVKLMFADKKFCNEINMSGVNSINWVRIITQIVYYFFSYFKLNQEHKKINFVVPTGNFGDIYAGYIAKKMGLPIGKLIIATNDNDILHRVINTGIYEPLKVKHTISPSMDIQIASNFERLIFDICDCNSNKIIKLMDDLKNNGKFTLEKKYLDKIKEFFSSGSLSDSQTKSVIKSIFKREGVLIDPHTAVGIGVSDKIKIDGYNVILSTAHPAKFSNVVEKETGIKPELPENLKNILSDEERFDKIPKDLKKVQNYILKRV